MSGEFYRVANSRQVAEQFRRATAEARAAGQLQLFVDSANWVLGELSRTPDEFGESRGGRVGNLVPRCGSAGCVFVEFAIHEGERIVFVRRLAFRRR